MPHSVRYVLLQFLSVSAYFYYDKTSAKFSSVTLGMYIKGLKAKAKSFEELYATLLHLPPLRFYCVSGCWDDGWDRTQNYNDFKFWQSQTLKPQGRFRS
jgi:hypothetical protein